MRIIDANILIYTWDQAAPQHALAKSWLEAIYKDDELVGVPRVVLLAFSRIVTNPRIMKAPESASSAFAYLDEMLSYPKTLIVEPGPRHWSIFRRVVAEANVIGPSITDAYLASLAIEHGSTLSSNDEGFRRYVGLSFENPLREFRV